MLRKYYPPCSMISTLVRRPPVYVVWGAGVSSCNTVTMYQCTVMEAGVWVGARYVYRGLVRGACECGEWYV